MKRTFTYILLLVAALMVAVSPHTRAATVTASIDPPQIALGDSAQLTITVTGSQDRPAVPEIPGLDITAFNQSSSIDIINGSVTMAASVIYSVTPNHEGRFVIPAIHVAGASSQPLTIVVSNGNAPSAPTPAPAQALPPSAVNAGGPVVMPPAGSSSAATPDADTPIPPRPYGSLRIVLPKKVIFVGELMPVDIKAYIPSGVQGNLDDMPQLVGDGFTLNQLGSKPERTEENVGSRAYTVLTWHSAITGVKEGVFHFDVEMPMTVVVPQQMPQADEDDPFNNFFRNAFATMNGTKKEVKIAAGDQTLTVLSVPAAGRPADFAGAVGNFEIETSAAPTRANLGDPLTLTLKVTGKGNFDRVSSDGLPSSPDWKTYAPKSHFDASDAVGFEGEKTFEQPIIANTPGVTAIPSLTFSFFNPETRQFVTRTAAPLAVTISGVAPSVAAAPAPVVPSSPGSLSPAPTAAAGAVASPAPAIDLAMNKIEPGTFFATLRPVYLSPVFLAAQTLPLLALLVGLGLIRRQQHIAHPERQRTSAMQQAIREEVDAMNQAMQHHQTDAFFIHARNALQQRFGRLWGLRPETITPADIEFRLGATASNIKAVFEMADQASFSGLELGEADLENWRQVVINELAEKRG